MDLNALFISLVTTAVVAALTFWTTRRSQAPAQQQQQQLQAMTALQATVSTLETHVSELQARMREKDDKHDAELTELRGQFMSALAQKDLRIQALQEELHAYKEVTLRQMTERDARITTLETELHTAQAALAEYAQMALRHPQDRTRKEDSGASVAE